MTPNFGVLGQSYKDYVLSNTFVFWRETDQWPIYEQPHRELFGELDASMPDMTFARKTPLAKMILAPRFTYKSYGASKAIARLVLKHPNISIGIFRATREDARKPLSVVKNILTLNPKVRDLFGDVSKGAQKWDEDQIVVSTRTISCRPHCFYDGRWRYDGRLASRSRIRR